MQEFLLQSDDITTGVFLIIAFFAAGVAFSLTIIGTTLFNFNKSPRWLLFVIYSVPAIVSSGWKMLNSLMIGLFISGTASLILILPLSFILAGPIEEIRIILIWGIVFISSFVFYSVHRDSISKWIDDFTQTQWKKETRIKKSRRNLVRTRPDHKNECFK